jgi:hypothetical protein
MHYYRDMPILLQSSETVGCGATIKLDNGDVVYVSVAGSTVSVRQWDLRDVFTTLISQLLGRKLYRVRGSAKNERAAASLEQMYPEQAAALPQFYEPLLAAFANAVWHCGSADEVRDVLREAAAKGPGGA